MDNRIITISREFGSGGRTIGKMTAEKLGIPYYDNELITLAAQESGFSPELFANADQNASNSLLFSLSLYGTTAGTYNMPIGDQVFLIQSDIIRKLASEKDCVIVGRCATNILKDKSLKLFIHAPFEERVQNVIRRTGREEASARKLVKKMDKERKAYYEYFTDSKWLDMTQYDLCIDSSRFSMEQIIEIVKRCL